MRAFGMCEGIKCEYVPSVCFSTQASAMLPPISPLLPRFLPSFHCQRKSLRWRVLNMPASPHESHCLLSSLKTSSSVPPQHHHPSRSALALLSLTFTGRPFCTFSLLVHLQWLHAALETVHEVDQGIKLPPYSLMKLSAISAFLCNCTYSPSQPSPFSFSPLHTAFIF